MLLESVYYSIVNRTALEGAIWPYVVCIRWVEMTVLALAATEFRSKFSSQVII